MLIRRTFCLVLALNLAATPYSIAAIDRQSRGKSNGPASNAKNTTILPGTILDNLNGSKSSQDGDDDHIPCELSEKDLLELRPRPEQATLNTVEAEQLKRKVLQSAIDAQKSGYLSQAQADGFTRGLKNVHLESLTYAEALNRILVLLASSTTDKSPSATQDQVLLRFGTYDAALDALPATDEIDDATRTLKGASSALSDIEQLEIKAAEALKAKQSSIGSGGTKEAKASLEQAQKDYNSRQTDLKLRRARIVASVPVQRAFSVYNRDKADADKLYLNATTSAAEMITTIERAIEGLDQSKIARSTAEKGSVTAKDTKKQSATTLIGLNSVADAARQAISPFVRPNDVGCAMALLDWGGMRYKFGQKVADEYLGVQITVRNMNPDKEFLLHDAELAVDMDLSNDSARHGATSPVSTSKTSAPTC